MPPLTGFILTAAEMRAAEAATMASGVSVDALMARAGAAIAEAVWRFGGGQPTLILCGPGNNGGDGYVAASILKARGLDVRVAAFGEPKTDVARRARAGWSGSVETLDRAAPAPVLLDAVFGTGLDRPLDAGLAGQLARLRQQADFVLAADVPSGVGSDDGADFGAIKADVTIALGALNRPIFSILLPGCAAMSSAPILGLRHRAPCRLSPVRVLRARLPPIINIRVGSSR